MSNVADPRFANIQSDPRYRLPSKRNTHTKIDKRFARMLEDDDFSKNAAVDRYGRRLRKDDTKKQLKRFYRLDEADDNEKEDVVGSEEDDKAVQREISSLGKRDYDPARDGGFSDSSSEESSSDEEEEVQEDDESEYSDKDGIDVPLGEVTRRIAIVNLDWDNIRAEDLMVVCSSFLPIGGRIEKVAIYPSEFGKERIEREEMEGPPRELFASKHTNQSEHISSEDEDSEDEKEIKQSIVKEDEGAEFNSNKLRKYQLERLRYYYAVLTISSIDSAKHIYDAIDGTEYLSSANFFDLRFVPDDTDFSDETPRDECTRLPEGYKPNDFVTDALQHSKVKLTWDADDKTRQEVQARAFRVGRNEIGENDLKAYLGSDSSDDDGDNFEFGDSTKMDSEFTKKTSRKEIERQRMRSLLGLGNNVTPKSKKEGPVGEMEVTFSAGLTAEPPGGSVFENEPTTEETTKEKYIRKEKERKARRKARMQATKNGESPPDAIGEADEERNKGIDEQKDLGFDDPFFTAPEHDPAVITAKRKEDKRKKKEERLADEATTASKRAELELLMVDEKSSGIKHFDMKDVEKAEKQARNVGKAKKGKKSMEPTIVQDDFKMNMHDPRFQSLFDSHEFAIDPSNPKFKPTKGMKALLEEGRKRKRNQDETASTNDVDSKNKKVNSGSHNMDDLDKLVDRIKTKRTKA